MLAPASWPWTGSPAGVDAKTMLALAQAAWSWAGAAVSINAKTMIAAASAAWNWGGRPLLGFAQAIYQNLMLFFGVRS
jgi:hypothetical protein